MIKKEKLIYYWLSKIYSGWKMVRSKAIKVNKSTSQKYKDPYVKQIKNDVWFLRKLYPSEHLFYKIQNWT